MMNDAADPRIEGARARFARSLVGSWHTAEGTFGVVMAQRWEIRPDGTGCFVDTGPFGAPESETRFEWRQDQPFMFVMREIERIEYGPSDPAGGDEDEDDDGAASPWITIPYDFILVRTDAGEQVGLVEIGRLLEEPGFHWSLAPLARDRRDEPASE